MATSSSNTIQQWASVVDSFSSQYDSTRWSANQILGPPKVFPDHGDIPGAWASKSCDSVEFVEIGFQEKVIPSAINIYETYHAGGVKRVMAKNPNGAWVELYKADRIKKISSSRIFSPVLSRGITFKTNKLRIEIDCSVARSWVELDAVELVGFTQESGASTGRNQTGHPSVNTSLWVREITNYSSQYNNSGWSARTVIGQPRVYPRYGDLQGSWASAAKDAHQFIEVAFEKKLYLREINIYETYHAGGVKRVSAKDVGGNWVTLYETDHCQCIDSSRIFSPQFNQPKFPVDELRIDIDCTASGSWVEIDAINIVGTTKPDMPSLSSCLSQLVNKKMFSDVEIIVEGLSFHGHKAILAQRSPFFRSVFVEGKMPETAQQPSAVPPALPSAPPLDEDTPPSYESLFGLPPGPTVKPAPPTPNQLYGVGNSGSMKEADPVQAQSTKLPVSADPVQSTKLSAISCCNPLLLDNVTPDVFGVILHFIYTEEIPDVILVADFPVGIDTMCVVRSARAAAEFGLPGLRAACERKLCTENSLSSDNVLEAFLESTKQPVLGTGGSNYFPKSYGGSKMGGGCKIVDLRGMEDVK
ncbi:uncharacterized protein LOC125669622 isoform X2 [Ostrea edulis]|uniref:uncharacterized protein LOC125669622 isoform X2 n=1 Tax=Ostrea edulis TaxID=37623 RepID=UPI0024AF57DC|nr:uncharacterized protein LOC125669622 isoform X2 [Ostrea edulis]